MVWLVGSFFQDDDLFGLRADRWMGDCILEGGNIGAALFSFWFFFLSLVQVSFFSFFFFFEALTKIFSIAWGHLIIRRGGE